MDNRQFQAALCYRLQLPQPCIKPLAHMGTLRCTCAAHPEVDPQGHHLITGCGKMGYRHRTHDNVNRELINYAGVATKREEQHCFRVAFPDSNLRPDISIDEGSFTNTKMVLDTAITCTLTGCAEQQPPTLTVQRASAVQEGRAARNMAAAKRRKYGDVAAANGLEFTPLIFESSGYMHDNLKQLLVKTAKFAAEWKKIPWDRLYGYMCTCLSMSLQKNQANSVLARAQSLRSGTHTAQTRISHQALVTFDDVAVQE